MDIISLVPITVDIPTVLGNTIGKLWPQTTMVVNGAECIIHCGEEIKLRVLERYFGYSQPVGGEQYNEITMVVDALKDEAFEMVSAIQREILKAIQNTT